MQVKPILFNTQMVRAIMEGRKTVTRRIADINTEITCNDGTANHEFVLDSFSGMPTHSGFICRKCGFGVAPPHSKVPCGSSLFRPRYWPNDILYVRETWRVKEAGYPPSYCQIEYKAGGAEMFDGIIALPTAKGEWKPSIHMPKTAARLFLKVTDIRMERLHDMTIEDVQKEGIRLTAREEECHCTWATEDCRQQPCTNRDAYLPAMYTLKFAELWDSTIRDDAYLTDSFSKNPWVWVIEFERCEKPDK